MVFFYGKGNGLFVWGDGVVDTCDGVVDTCDGVVNFICFYIANGHIRGATDSWICVFIHRT